MTNTKITYVSTINTILTAIQNKSFDGITADHVEKLIALGQSLEKRNGATRKPTKKQGENESIKAQIKESITDCEPMTCGEIANMVGISGQKCSALLSQMVTSGEVIKTTEKRVSKFALADTDDPVQALPGELDA